MAEEKKELSMENSGGPQETEEKKEPESIESTAYCCAQALITAVVGVVALFTFFVRLIGVSGGSMQDTLYTGDRLLVLNSVFCDFQPGDVVVVNDYNAELDETLVKRIIAVGGQTVDIDFTAGVVYVDGQPLEEPYTKEPTYKSDSIRFPLTLEEDEVFVMGDNRNHSTDSRSGQLGPVKEGYLQGKALLLLIPGQTPDAGHRDWSRVGAVSG